MRERTVVFVFATLLALPLRTLGQSSFQYDANGNLTNVTSVIPSGLPTITAPPTNQDVIIGEDAGFSVAVTGSGPIGYQWFLNGVAVQGATNSTIFIPSSAVSNQGSYSVVVSNPSGAVTSTVPALLVFNWTWIAPGPAEWNDPSSWDPEIVPTGFYNINLTSGTVLLDTPVTMTGDLTWSGGTIGAGLLTIAPSATLTVAGVNGNVYDVQGVWTNAGTIELVSGDFRLNSGDTPGQGQLINLPGAVLDITTNVSVYNAYGNEVLVNEGTVEKTGGSGNSLILPTFDNTGLVDVQTGTLSIDSGGSGDGVFEADAGAAMNFANNYTANSGAQFLGNGINELTVGTLTLNGDVIGSSLVLAGGTCFLNGTVSNMTLAGALLAGTNGVVTGFLTWTGGYFATGSTLTVATNGTVVLEGVNGNVYDVEGILTNAGIIELVSGNLRLNSGSIAGEGQLINLPGAVLDITTNVSVYNASGNELLVNEGTIEKTGGMGTSTIYPIIDNTGLVDVQTGTVAFNGGDTSGSTGIYETTNGTTLEFMNTYIINSGTAFTGTGINVMDTGTLTINGPVTVDNAVLDFGTCILNGLVTMSNVTLAGAVLTGTNGVIAGALNWTSGYFALGSTLTVATNGTVILEGVTGNVYDVEGILTNAGIIELVSGNLRLNSGNYAGEGQLINLPGAVLDITTNVSVYSTAGNEVLVNEGTIEKTGGTGTSTIYPIIDNTGLVDVQTGTVAFNGGDTSGSTGIFETANGTTLEFMNTYIINSGTAFTGSGINVMDTGTLTINGPVTVDNAVLDFGTCVLNGLVTMSNVTLAGAVLTGTNGVIAGALNWTSGYFALGSTLTVATNGTVILEGVTGNVYDVEGILTNAGTIELVSGNLRLNSGNVAGQGQLINLSGAVLDITTNVSIDDVNGDELLSNEGTVEKSGGTGISVISSMLNNNGLVEVLAGTLNLAGLGTGNGVFETGTRATLTLSGGYTANSGSQFVGSGINELTGGTLTLNGDVTGTDLVLGAGTCVLNGAVSNLTLAGASLGGNNGVISGLLTWSSGTLAIGSILTVATNGALVLDGVSGNSYTMYGILTNAGTFKLASGNLQLAGSCDGGFGEVVNLPDAIINLATNVSILGACGNELLINEGVLEKTGGTGTSTINPVFINSGLVKAVTGNLSLNGSYVFIGGELDCGISGPTNFGSIHFAGSAPLNGLGLNVYLENAFLPADGDSFAVVTYGSEAGAFATTNLPNIGSWQATYGSSAFTLTALSVRPNLIPSLYTNGEPDELPQLLLQFTGNTNVNYTVLASTNLALPFSNWTVLGAPLLLSSNLYLFIDSESPNIPTRFYIMRSP